MIYLILPLNRKNSTMIASQNWYNIRITIWMLHTVTEWLEICTDINIELTWIFTSRIIRFALEKTFLLNKVFFPANGLQVTLIK